jgi:hypothetical protein
LVEINEDQKALGMDAAIFSKNLTLMGLLKVKDDAIKLMRELIVTFQK